MAKKVFSAQTVTAGELLEGGYCKVENEPKLMVYGALPGEQITAMPFSKRGRKIFAHTQAVHQAHEHRVEPPCAVADVCGGCSLQHLDSKEQINTKQTLVAKTFADVGVEPEAWFSPLRGDVGGYRAKARLGVKYVDKKEKVLVGFREKHKPFIVETQTCHVLKAPIGNLLGELAELIAGLSIPRHIPQIEVAIGDGDAALVFRHLEPLSPADLLKLEDFAKLHKLQIFLQSDKTIEKFYPKDEQAYLTYRLADFAVDFDFKPLDFTQVNSSINQQMVKRALELLELKGEDRVLDAFCGIGNFSLPLARTAAHVIGIEASEESVTRAIHNAEQNGINNAVFIAQDLFAESLEISGFQSINKVLLDPPRSGAESLCKKLASHKVERLVYVSCNPVSLARDAKILVESGYKFAGAGVIDMFPHTTHVESIASFTI